MSAIFQRLLRRPIRRRDPEPPTTRYIEMSPKHELVGHQDWVWISVLLQDNEHIVSGSDDGTMRKWDCETGLLVGEPWEVEDPVYALALSPDGKMIAYGRGDGSVQRWDTSGQMMEGIWTGHGDRVRALSWSPSGHHLASGSDDGTILIRNAESGQVEVGPINADQTWVRSVAYSPSGDRIASGGDNNISIWDSHTGELRVGPIQGNAWSIVWSFDGSKLYSGGRFAHVLDSASGTELHRFEHGYLYSIALSPKRNLLAGVGRGIVQLWDIETYQPLGQSFHGDTSASYFSVSFSPDGRYLAYGGSDRKITLSSTQELLVPQASSINPLDDAQQEALPKSPPPSCPDTNLLAQSAVNNDNACNQPYNSFFTPSKSSLPLPLPKSSAVRRFKAAFSPRVPHLRTPKGKLRAGSYDKQCDGVNRPRIVGPGATERSHDKGKQREEPIIHEEPSSRDLSPPAELDSNENRALWKLLQSRKTNGKNPSTRETQCSPPEVVEVSAARGFKRIIVHKRKRKTRSLAPMSSNSTALANAGESSQTAPPSHGDPANPLSQGIPEPSSQPIPIAGCTEIGCTDNDSCSDSSTIQGPCLRFLDKICFSC